MSPKTKKNNHKNASNDTKFKTKITNNNNIYLLFVKTLSSPVGVAATCVDFACIDVVPDVPNVLL